jgi:hypothetical protein
MLGMAISLLFALAAFSALSVIRWSLVAGSARARLILAELAELDRRAAVKCPAAGSRAPRAYRPHLAAA